MNEIAHLDPARCPLIVVGDWNVSIFTPEWVKELPRFVGASDVEFAIALPVVARRIDVGDVQLTVAPTQLKVQPRGRGREHLRSVAETASEILSKLPETPVRAFGMNIGATVSGDYAPLLEALSLGDRERFRKATEAPELTVTRRWAVGETRVSLSVERKNPKRIRIDFNYHRDASKAKIVSQSLSTSVHEDFEHATDLLASIYDLELR